MLPYNWTKYRACAMSSEGSVPSLWTHRPQGSTVRQVACHALANCLDDAIKR